MKKVFIIHGWSYSLDKWTDICAQLKDHNIEPVLLKVPGLTEKSDAVWDIDDYVHWLDGKLKGASDPIVIGHSNGGRIALSYIQKHPGRIKQLILIDSAGIPHDQLTSRTKLGFLRTVSHVGKIFARIPLIKKVFYKLIGARDYYNAPPNMKLTMQNMLKADSMINYAQINLPVTIIWGSDDTITPLNEGRLLHERLKDSELHIIDGARHAPQATHPQEVLAIISKVVEA